MSWLVVGWGEAEEKMRSMFLPALAAAAAVLTFSMDSYAVDYEFAGFSTAQFATFDALDARLARQRYLCGDRLTEADWRLFTTLLRFDPVYHGHFKCNRRRLADYANLWGFTRELYQVPGVAETVDIEHIKRHYYASQLDVNPTGVVPTGPDIDYAAPHDREHLPAAAQVHVIGSRR